MVKRDKINLAFFCVVILIVQPAVAVNEVFDVA